MTAHCAALEVTLYVEGSCNWPATVDASWLCGCGVGVEPWCARHAAAAANLEAVCEGCGDLITVTLTPLVRDAADFGGTT